MDQFQFTRRQYAGSGRNRDGIQASIADLVYLLGVISGDTLAASNLPETAPYSVDVGNRVMGSGRNISLDSHPGLTVNIESPEPLGGAYFAVEFDPEIADMESLILNGSVEGLELNRAVDDGKLMVAVLNRDKIACSFVDGDLAAVYFDSISDLTDSGFEIVMAEFSDGSGFDGDAVYRAEISEKTSSETPGSSGISISGNSNPFNGSVTVSYELPFGEIYDPVIFDILRGEVKTFMKSYKSSGGGAIVWDGTDNYGGEV